MGFIETRGNDGTKPASVPFSEAILSPSASFGGLYVPEAIPQIDGAFLETYAKKGYKALAKAILEKFAIDIPGDSIDEALATYDRFDDPSDPAPLAAIGDGNFVCELWHGPTRAFKDMALQPFGVLLSQLAAKKEEHFLILAATSGDTGPAALSTFEDRPFIKVACLYPDGGTSDVQRLQMTTMAGENLKVLGIHGDFDDAQTALKSMLASDHFKAALKEKHTSLSAANSVNFGRIIFQIVYHFHGYLELMRRGELAPGEKITLVVPSGNFGNALGGYYAKKMGLPVEKILIASNANNILTDLITKGAYDLNGKKLAKTTSPAMDILKSSNVERVLYDMFGPERTRELMDELAETDKYVLTESERTRLREDFDAAWSDDEEVAGVIKKYADGGYLMDTHTATCLKAADLFAAGKKTVIYSTAQWVKFAPVVWGALSGEAGLHDKEALEKVAERCGVDVPSFIKELFHRPVRHDTVIAKETIEEEVVHFL